jgi:uncharacterized protein (TIGR03086 family)
MTSVRLDVRAADRRVLATVAPVVAAVPATAWSDPTPCAGWTLRDLVEHMTGQHAGFAASARGGAQDLTAWRPLPGGVDPAAGYAAAAADVTDAFGTEGLLERDIWVPEIRPDKPVPARIAVGFHVLDYVVHGWDVAASLGRPVDFGPDLLAFAEVLAGQVPTDPARRGPGAAFAPVLDPPATAGPLARILTLLGRDPAWTPSQPAA